MLALLTADACDAIRSVDCIHIKVHQDALNAAGGAEIRKRLAGVLVGEKRELVYDDAMGTIATELLEPKRDERGRWTTPAAEREALVRAYTESGLTQKAFAKKEGVKYPTFVSWVQEHRRRSSTPKVGFAELTLPRAVAGVAPLEVRLADGTIIRGSQAEEVARLLKLIRC